MEKDIIETKLKSLYAQVANTQERITEYAAAGNYTLVKREVNSLIELDAKLVTVEVMYAELRK